MNNLSEKMLQFVERIVNKPNRLNRMFSRIVVHKTATAGYVWCDSCISNSGYWSHKYCQQGLGCQSCGSC